MSDLEQVRQRFIEAGGQLSQSAGLGRVLGQIFAQIYFSPQAQTLDDLVEELEVSKGAASMAIRQLHQWGAVRQVWIKGERKDYYEACDDFGRIVRQAMLDLIGRRMASADQLLSESEEDLSSAGHDGKNADLDFLDNRLRTLRTFRDRAQNIWDSSLVQLLMKR